MKALYWKKTLLPSVTGAYDFVWIFDNDIGIDELNLPWFTEVMRQKDILIMQPRIIYPKGQIGEFAQLLWHPGHEGSCDAVSTDYVEPQMPVMTSRAWTYFHANVLSVVPERALFETDYGIPDTWCRILHAGRANGWKPPPRTHKCLSQQAYDARPACAIANAGVHNFDYDTIARHGDDAAVRGGSGWYWRDQFRDVIFPGCMDESDWGRNYDEKPFLPCHL